MSAPITLTGGVVADPELKFGQSGTAVLRLRVATSQRRLNKETQKWEDVDQTYWDVSAFRQLAENAAESLVKGSQVIVTGKAKSRSWEDREGNKRVSWEVVADHIGLDLVRVKASANQVNRVSKPADDDPWSDAAPF